MTQPPTQPDPAPDPDPVPEPEPTPDPEKVPKIEDPEALWRSHEKYRHEAHGLRRQLDQAQGELEDQKQASMSEHEKALAKAVKEAEERVRDEMGGQILTQAIKAAAASKMNDPADAIHWINPEGLDPDDPEGIDKAIDELLKAKPYLATAPNGGRGRIDQGPQGGRAPEPAVTGDDWLRSVAGRGQT